MDSDIFSPRPLAGELEIHFKYARWAVLKVPLPMILFLTVLHSSHSHGLALVAMQSLVNWLEICKRLEDILLPRGGVLNLQLVMQVLIALQLSNVCHSIAHYVKLNTCIDYK